MDPQHGPRPQRSIQRLRTRNLRARQTRQVPDQHGRARDGDGGKSPHAGSYATGRTDVPAKTSPKLKMVAETPKTRATDGNKQLCNCCYHLMRALVPIQISLID